MIILYIIILYIDYDLIFCKLKIQTEAPEGFQ